MVSVLHVVILHGNMDESIDLNDKLLINWKLCNKPIDKNIC